MTLHFSHKDSFTLVELLVVIGILAILTAAVVIVLNPAELLKQSRDSKRTTDLASLNNAIKLLLTQNPDINLGSASTVYISLADSSSTCGSYALPALPAGWRYSCATSANYQKVDGTGWIPVNFSSAGIVASLPALPADPANTATDGQYYAYAAGGSWQLSAHFESAKYLDKADKDGGSLTRYEVGTNLALTPSLATRYKLANAGSAFSADQAEAYCTSTYGSQYKLFAPRTASELNEVQKYIIEQGGSYSYLYIMGIYPKVQGNTCTYKAMTSESCTGWRANDDKGFYVSTRTDIAEPNGDNCTTGSMRYPWNGDGTAGGYNDIACPGYTSQLFVCQEKQ